MKYSNIITKKKNVRTQNNSLSYTFITIFIMVFIIFFIQVNYTLNLNEPGTRYNLSKRIKNVISNDYEWTKDYIYESELKAKSAALKLKIYIYQTTQKNDINDKDNNINIKSVVNNKPIEVINIRKRIAYAITITRDGPFQDGAAVLAYSIFKYSKDIDYNISLIAFVHPNVTTSRPVLNRLGFHVIEAMVPINSSAIPFKWFREHIEKNGCCGSSELIKLNSYRLMQYHRIIHLDADTFFLNPIIELFERNYSLIYTTDPNMASHKGVDKLPVQGGFILLTPSLEDYKNLINIMLTVEFRRGSAWNGTKIGWFWGGMTVQGVLPYYYNAVTEANRTQTIDRCFYNTMADTKPCETQTLDELKSAHFTVCQKPWGCWTNFRNNLCKQLHARWFAMRKETEAYYGIPVIDKACAKGGHKQYKYMQLDDAKLPVVSNFIHDDSPDVLYPIYNSGYSKSFN
jgi:hypothetical protein